MTVFDPQLYYYQRYKEVLSKQTPIRYSTQINKSRQPSLLPIVPLSLADFVIQHCRFRCITDLFILAIVSYHFLPIPKH